MAKWINLEAGRQNLELKTLYIVSLKILRRILPFEGWGRVCLFNC